MARINELHFTGPFNLVSLQSEDPILDESSGVYIIWQPGAGKWVDVIYVGQVSSQPVRKRLEQHLTNCKNQILQDCMRAPNSALQFCFLRCKEGKARHYEDKLTELLEPEADMTRQRN